MKIVLAMDKFRESAPAGEICAALRKGLEASGAFPGDTEIIELPLADGGEGITEILAAAMERKGCRIRWIEVDGLEDPLGRPVSGKFALAYSGERPIAIMEMSSVSGLWLLDKGERNPMKTSTYGTGQLIRAALENSPDKIILGLGGSATVDGGTGCAAAMGVEFRDERGDTIERPCGATLSRIRYYDISGLDSRLMARLMETELLLAVDVDNPLTGPDGAAQVYGPQKGALPKDTLKLDRGLEHFTDLIRSGTGKDYRGIPGTGAAGGLPLCLLAFAGGRMEPGYDLVMRETGFDETVRGSDLVITGEGRFDRQSLSGKVVSAVSSRCHAQGIPVLVLAGTAPLDIVRMGNSGKVPGVVRVETLVSDDSDAEEVDMAKRNVLTLLEEKGRGLAPVIVELLNNPS